jgi:hypothetical protein
VTDEQIRVVVAAVQGDRVRPGHPRALGRARRSTKRT